MLRPISLLEFQSIDYSMRRKGDLHNLVIAITTIATVTEVERYPGMRKKVRLRNRRINRTAR